MGRFLNEMTPQMKQQDGESHHQQSVIEREIDETANHIPVIAPPSFL
jgi:hypothetical protein